MQALNKFIEPLQQIAAIGGPVVVVLMGVAVLTLAVVLYKVWQFWMAAVGRHRALKDAVVAWDHGDRTGAQAALLRSKSYLAPVIFMAMTAQPDGLERLQAEAETRFARLESGLRLLDSVAQLA